MAALTDDIVLTQETGDFNEYPIAADTLIYKGAAVGDNGSGYARPLEAGDRFLGHALAKADNSGGAAGDLRVRTYGPNVYRLKHTLSGAAITDVGTAIACSDDNVITTTLAGSSIAGRIVRYVETDTVIVEFTPCVDPS